VTYYVYRVERETLLTHSLTHYVTAQLVTGSLTRRLKLHWNGLRQHITVTSAPPVRVFHNRLNTDFIRLSLC